LAATTRATWSAVATSSSVNPSAANVASLRTRSVGGSSSLSSSSRRPTSSSGVVRYRTTSASTPRASISPSAARDVEQRGLWNRVTSAMHRPYATRRRSTRGSARHRLGTTPPTRGAPMIRIVTGHGRYADPWHPFAETSAGIASVAADLDADHDVVTVTPEAIGDLDGV